MFNYLKKKIKRRRYQKEWRRRNSHNLTTPVNIFDLNKVTIGRGTYGPIEVYSWDNPEEKLVIGNFCSIARGVKFVLGGNHFFRHLSNYPWPMFFGGEVQPAETSGPIIIEDGVWIGMDAMILSGVTLGKGAVIGSRAVVAKNIPPYAIVVGNPGKIVRYRFDEETIEQLKKLDSYQTIDKKMYDDLFELLNQPLTKDLINILKNY